MVFAEKKHKSFDKNHYNSFVLGADIGGTNTGIGIFGIKNKLLHFLLSFHFKSRELKAPNEAIKETLDYIRNKHKIKITKACIAVAGVLSHKKDYVKTQNLPWNVGKKKLSEGTGIKKVLFINDFEAIGYGINMLAKNDLVVVKKAKKITKAPMLIIGAGSGLGKTSLIYDECLKSYIPIPSEAGHSDFPAQNEEELEVISFIQKSKKVNSSISYEMALSGQGLENLYSCMRQSKKFTETKYNIEIDKSKNKPELISRYRKVDWACNAAFDLFKSFYAKFARNFALDALAFGGVYIAGGIAAKNRDIFDKTFINYFEQNHRFSGMLRKMPIYIIKNYNAGLLGAGFAAAKLLGQRR